MARAVHGIKCLNMHVHFRTDMFRTIHWYEAVKFCLKFARTQKPQISVHDRVALETTFCGEFKGGVSRILLKIKIQTYTKVVLLSHHF